MQNQMMLLLSLVVSLQSASAAAADCKIFFTSKDQVESPLKTNAEIRELSKVINRALKESYQVLYKIDSVTLGLASAIATGGVPIDDLKPEQWDKFNIVGNVIYQDSSLSGTALRGAKLTFSEGTTSRTTTTGTQGEFSEAFHNLVPYSRIRLFGSSIFAARSTFVPTINLPVKVKIESKFCNAETTLDKVPLEPLVFVLSHSEPGDSKVKE